MHPAEKELILGALEQIEASCRTLRRYLVMAAREGVQASVPATNASYAADDEIGEDQLAAMLGKMLMGEPSGEKNNV